METPGKEDWSLIHELAEELGELPPREAEERLVGLEKSGNITGLGTWVRHMLALAPPPMELKSGDSVAGRYVLREKLGEGGMGVVWRADQEFTKQEVALKMLRPSLMTPALSARFLAEMATLGHLHHTGIVRIFDAGMHSAGGVEAPFFAMELVEGQRLDRWAARHRDDRAEILRLMAAVCSAVQHAHERGVVHRDLKPANILVRPDGRPVVLDFGLARPTGGADPADADPADGAFAGTPAYASPERFLGKDRDFRSGESVDVYAAGAILHEVLSGHRLFQFSADTPFAVIRRTVLEETPPRLREVLPDCPAEVEEVVSRAVRRAPEDRYYSMSGLGRALLRLGNALASPAASVPVWEPAAGAVIPATRWLLEEKLGEGAVGQIWTGRHTGLDERRVFKFCDTEAKARTLKRELTLFRLLKDRVGRNPHFIPLHEVSLDEPPFYLMMDHVESVDLARWCLRSGGPAKVPLETRLEIVAQAADALQAAHDSGVLHRDVKPSNLLIEDRETSDGGPPAHVRLTDFGIGQIITEELLAGGRAGFTRTVSNLRAATLSGTQMYMAPEVIAGYDGTARSDLYSLGVVLFQLVAENLQRPVTVDWEAAVPDPLLREDLRLCLAGDPADRFPAAAELAVRLRAHGQRRQEAELRRAELAERERAAYRRGIMRTAAVAAVIVGIIAVLAVIAMRQRKEAQTARALGDLEQAKSVAALDTKAGRRARGLALLSRAAEVPQDAPAMRSTLALLQSLVDLTPVATPPGGPDPALTLEPGDTARAVSAPAVHPDFVGPLLPLLAVGSEADDVSGALEFRRADTGDVMAAARDRPFPWIPVPEPSLFAFSPDGSRLAVGGEATSSQILLIRSGDAGVASYFHLNPEPAAAAWHPGGRLLASGQKDGAVRIWDTWAAAAADAGKADAALPPALDVPAIEEPMAVLRGHRDRITSLLFHPEGGWLFSMDAAGWLRVWSGFVPAGLPGMPAEEEAPNPRAGSRVTPPALLLETPVSAGSGGGTLSFRGKTLLVTTPDGRVTALLPEGGPLLRERWLAPAPGAPVWSPDGAVLAVPAGADLHWVSAVNNSLEEIAVLRGKHPAGFSVNPETKNWGLALPDGFVEIPPGDSAPGRIWGYQEDRKNTQGRLTDAVGADGGRMAVYSGRDIFFAEPWGKSGHVLTLPPETAGPFLDLVWDRGGRLLAALTEEIALEGSAAAGRDGVKATCWTTSAEGKPAEAGVLFTTASRIVAAEDGAGFFGRGVRCGLVRLKPGTDGAAEVLDDSPAARQDAALAVTPDGKRIAAVADRSAILLLDAATGEKICSFLHPGDADITHLTWSPAGDRIAAVTAGGALQIWDLAPWRAWLTARGISP